LAAERLGEMEALPQFRQGDLPAFLATLRYLIGMARGDAMGVADARAEAERLMGGEIAAGILVFGFSLAAKGTAFMSLPNVKTLSKAQRAGLPAALAKVAALVRDLGIAKFSFTEAYLAEAAKQFARVSGSLDTAQLRTLAELALGTGQQEFAYAAAGAGLTLDKSTAARFLYLRARSLQEKNSGRRAVCAAAAAELARAHRDMELVDRAVEMVRACYGDEAFSLTLDQAGEVLRKEIAASTFPKGKRRGDPDYSNLLPENLCYCPECRSKRGELPNPFDDDGLDEAGMKRIFDEKTPADMPPEIAGMLFELMKATYLRGEDPEKVISSLLDDLLHVGKAKGRRK
jgi:hypothetical protein